MFFFPVVRGDVSEFCFFFFFSFFLKFALHALGRHPPTPQDRPTARQMLRYCDQELGEYHFASALMVYTRLGRPLSPTHPVIRFFFYRLESSQGRGGSSG